MFTKIEEEDIDIWFQQDGALFEDRIINRRADVVWPPRSCDLTPLDYYLWGNVKDKCYADKPETIDALKANIREAIGEIQLHTIDNMLINWTDQVGYCMASRSRHLNEIILNKKTNLRKYSVVFFKEFPKKIYLADPIFISQVCV